MPRVLGIIPSNVPTTPVDEHRSWSNPTNMTDGNAATFAESDTGSNPSDIIVTSAARIGHEVWAAVDVTYEIVGGSPSSTWRIEFGTAGAGREILVSGGGTGSVAKVTTRFPVAYAAGPASAAYIPQLYAWASGGGAQRVRIYEVTLAAMAGARVEVIG